ncbi:MAG: VOC family protein [Acetobacteraceae bacterium]|nr:VOC family protein [Pseudomonadota bacterium]
MPINVVEIHHTGLRINGDQLDANLAFYQGVLGLKADEKRPTIPGVPGYWINVGDVGQIHLIGGAVPSPLAKGEGKDPAAPHIALAVKDIQEAKAELDRLGTQYWSLTGINGPKAEQIFLRDPNGNLVELHQVDQCRCRAANRQPV